MSEELIIKKRSHLKGDDGHKIITIRIRDELVEELDKIANKTDRSRNEIIKIMLEFGIKNCIIEEQ